MSSENGNVVGHADRSFACPLGFSLADPDAVADPHPFYNTLRERDPVHFDEKLGMHVVARHEDIMTVLRDAAGFSQEIGWYRQFARGYLDELKAILIRDGGGYLPEVLQSDPPYHTRIRALLEKAFSSQAGSARLEAGIDDDARLIRFVEELLRYAPPVRALFRTTTRAVELAGTPLPEGATVMMLFASGNEDEEVFACPRTFDMERKNVIRHVAFGGGIHLCAGIALARMEIRTAIREIMTRLKDIRLTVAPEAVRVHASASFRAIESLPLSLARRC